MSRIQSLASRPKRTLGALAVVLAAVGITVGSGASFTASQANAGNAFATGNLHVGNESGKVILTASKMAPGDPATTGTVDIQNTGTVPGHFSLAGALDASSDASLASALQLTITDCGAWTTTPPSCSTGSSVFAPGNLDQMLGTSLTGNGPAGKFAAGEKHRYLFSVQLPDSGGNQNGLQDKTVTATYTWSATTA